MRIRNLLLLLIAVPVFAQTTDKMSEDFRLAGLRAIRAIHDRIGGSNQLTDRDAKRSFDEADIQRKTPADDRTFQQIKDYAMAAEVARVDVANARINAMIRARKTGGNIMKAADAMPDTESVRLEKTCNAQLEASLRSASTTDNFSCSEKK